MGMLLTPIIVFMVTSVPPEFGSSAGATAVSIRLLGTTHSIAAINYFQLYGSSVHFDRFQNQLAATDPAAVSRIKTYESLFSHQGNDAESSATGAAQLLKNLLA